MNWREFALIVNPSLTVDDIQDLLWNETCFPCGRIRMTIYQFRTAIRAFTNRIPRCDMCGQKKPYHDKHCPYVEWCTKGGDAK
jgi:hypothetical protein